MGDFWGEDVLLEVGKKNIVEVKVPVNLGVLIIAIRKVSQA